MDRLLQDLRYAVRSLRGSALTSSAAVASLALGIGAVSAIFGAIDVFMFRPLDYEDAEELVAVYTTDTERGWTTSSSSVADFVDWRRESRSLDLAAYTWVGLNLAGAERPERLLGYRVSPGFFDLLGEEPLLGRTFRPEEEEPGRSRVVVLGEGVWRRNFGGDPSVVGRTLRMDGEPWQVIGVMPADFTFAGGDQDVWVPLEVTGTENRGSRFLSVVGRLRDGATVPSATRELESIQARLGGLHPDTNAGKGARAIALRDDWFDTGFRQGSMIAGTAVIFVLLIACANVANLLLARGAARSREIALRSALGAGRSRIIRQLLTESLLLAVVGGLLGVGVGYLGIEGIKTLFPPFVPGIEGLALGGRVLAITLAATVLGGVLAGLAPTLQASRPDLRSALTEGGRGGSSVRGGRLRRGLVAAEIGLSVVLLVSALLLVKGYAGVRSNELGYRIDDVVTLRLTLSADRYDEDEELVQFQRTLLERVRAVPGVVAAGAANGIPMQSSPSISYRVVGEEAPADGRDPVVWFRTVTPGYLETMGMPVVAGRAITSDDVGGSPPVVVVNERFAERHWGERSPLGERIVLAGSEREVVGVVGNTRDWGPDASTEPVVYMPVWQVLGRNMTLVVHTGVDPATLAGAVREEVAALDPDQPVYELTTMAERTKEQLSGEMAMLKVLGALALVAFLLASLGVYGVMAYSVAQRRREMGVRVALGAQAADVRGLVVRQGMALAALGIGGGLLVALGTTRMLAFFLFGVSPYDPFAFGSVVLLLGVTALAASWIPAVRATRIDPVEALSA